MDSRFIDRIKKLNKLRPTISHGTLLSAVALALILFVAACLRLLPLRWEIPTGTVHLSEFDPYYYYSLAHYMTQHGLLSPYWPTQWIDPQRWYPTGLNMAMSLPALPMTAAFLYDILAALGVPISLMTFCAFFPVLAAVAACILVYFIGKQFGGRKVGLFAALFLAVVPTYIERTSLGFFDDETIGITAMLLFMLLFLRALEDRPMESTAKYSIAAGMALGYLICGWGASQFPVALTILFTVIMLIRNKYSQRLLLTFSITFGLALFIPTFTPYLGLGYLKSTTSVLAAGTFVLLLLFEIQSHLKLSRLKMVIGTAVAVVVGAVVLGSQGLLANVGGKMIAVIDPYLRGSLSQSVAEQRIASWASIYYEVGVLILFFLIGVYFLARNLDLKTTYLLVFALTSLYFACSMARLMALFAPAFALTAALGLVGVLNPFMVMLKEKQVSFRKKALPHVSRDYSAVAILLIFVVLVANFTFLPRYYQQANTPVTITAGAMPIAPGQPVSTWTNMLAYLQTSLSPSTVVCSWWDYGDWITILGNVTTLVDNTTINSTAIENVGFALMANETASVKMLKVYNAKYVLVFATIYVQPSSSGGVNVGWLGFGDEGKWTWMARISGEAKDRLVSQGYIDAASMWTNESSFGAYNSTQNRWVWNSRGENCTIYALMSYAAHEYVTQYGLPEPTGEPYTTPTNFKVEYIAGLDLTPQNAYSIYGGVVPLVCLYRVNDTAP